MYTKPTHTSHTSTTYSKELPFNSPHDHILLLLIHKFPHIIRPTATILLQFIHVIIHQPQFLRPLVQLPLHVLPVALLRAGGGTGGAWARGLFGGGFVGSGLGDHAFGGGSVWAADFGGVRGWL